MNNKIYERLSSLFKELGISLESGSAQRAELLGYCAGLSLADEEMNKICSNTFLDTADKAGIARFLSMTGQSAGETDEESKKIIMNALSYGKGLMPLSELEAAVRAVDPMAQYEIRDGVFILKYGSGIDYEALEKIKTFARNYAPACYRLELGGNGFEWDFWDDFDLAWYEIDELALPFSAFETL